MDIITIIVGGVLIAHFVLIGWMAFNEGYYRKDTKDASGAGACATAITLAITTIIFTILLLGEIAFVLIFITIPSAIGIGLLIDKIMKNMGSESREAKEKSNEAKERRIVNERKMNEFRASLKQWEAEGYSGLKDIIAIKNFDQMEGKFSEAEQKVNRLKAVESTLNKLSQDFPDERAVFELEMESIRKKHKDLSKVDEVEREIENLKNELNRYYQLKNEILDSITKVTYE